MNILSLKFLSQGCLRGSRFSDLSRFMMVGVAGVALVGLDEVDATGVAGSVNGVAHAIPPAIFA